MASSDLPDPVRDLISRHIESVLELEVLLAMRATAGAVECAELARELRLNEAACGVALDKFVAAGFLTRDAAGHSFSPAGAAARSSVDALADTYARRRVSVIRFIYKRPSPGVSAFADAFRLRKDD